MPADAHAQHGRGLAAAVGRVDEDLLRGLPLHAERGERLLDERQEKGRHEPRVEPREVGLVPATALGLGLVGVRGLSEGTKRGREGTYEEHERLGELGVARGRSHDLVAICVDVPVGGNQHGSERESIEGADSLREVRHGDLPVAVLLQGLRELIRDRDRTLARDLARPEGR